MHASKVFPPSSLGPCFHKGLIAKDKSSKSIRLGHHQLQRLHHCCLKASTIQEVFAAVRITCMSAVCVGVTEIEQETYMFMHDITSNMCIHDGGVQCVYIPADRSSVGGTDGYNCHERERNDDPHGGGARVQANSRTR